MDFGKLDLWPKNQFTYYIEATVIILTAIFYMSLQYGRLDLTILLSTQLGIRIFGTLLIWFANKFTIEHVLQSKIDANKVTQFLPLELTMASIAITSVIYLIFYPILVFLNEGSLVFAKFFRGLFATCGFSLLIVIFYAGIHIWRSWWSDGEFLFLLKNKEHADNKKLDFITVKNSRGTINHDLEKILYFISESKVVFLVDSIGKKWTTQYTISELEDLVDNRFFRLNRQIMVSRTVISQIKKLPNHRLLVTIGESSDGHNETISRYKSTLFKQWFHSSHTLNDHSERIQ